MKKAEETKSNDMFIRQQYDSVIKQTRKLIRDMTQQQRFQKARSHVMDALHSRQPRPLSNLPQLSELYYVLYYMQTSYLWQWLTFVLSFFYMYLVILDNQSYVQKISIEGAILVFFIIDLIIDFYCQSFDRLTIRNRYSKLYYFKAIILFLMIVDLIIFITLPRYHNRPIRPFRILRVLLPPLYDSQLRKSLLALLSAYKQIFAYMIYFLVIIVTFAFVGSQSITFDSNYVDPNYPNIPYGPDPYFNNYNNFGQMIYHVYGLATYDFFPDYQYLAMQNYEPNYIFYAVFLFLNMFLFVSIPGAVIYNKFRQTRSRYILMDEIKQQHSLILAFVTLAQEELNLSMQMLVKFLFYLYRHKVRYIEYITEICLILDDNNNHTIQVNEFMQLSKIILNNSVMYPPSFDDVTVWISFRKLVNQSIYLKDVVQFWLFDGVVSIITVLCCINGFFLLINQSHINKIFDTIFIWLFFGELVIRIVAIGPEKYFAYRWYSIDAFLIMLNVLFYFVVLHSNIDNLFIVNRMFRVAFFFRTLLFSKTLSSFQLYIPEKLKRLFETFVQIFPIITRFFLVFALCFFVFGILGMQIFFNTEQDTNYDLRYSDYVQFSNFITFIHSQYIMMQILTEGSWTKVVYNYCWRNKQYYALIVGLFIIMHFMIVYVIGYLLKGIFWQCYFTISSILNEIDDNIREDANNEQQNKAKTQQINEINQQIDQNQQFQPNTIMRRQLIQMKMDIDILKRIKNYQNSINQLRRASQRSIRSKSRSKIVQKMIQSWKIDTNQLQSARKLVISSTSKMKRKKAVQLSNLQEKQFQDFQSQMQELLNRLIISPKMKYSQIIAYPSSFVQFLNSKFKEPRNFIGNKFDVDLNPLYNDQSMKYHMYELSELIGLQNSQRVKKELIVEFLVHNNLIDEALAQKITKTKLIINKFHIDSNGAFRKMFLAETNEDLVKKLQIQYFSDVYGHSFKQINKVTLGPLLKVESSLTYALWNILSYPQIPYTNFFHILTNIEDQISNKLLKKGSLFKFVYKISSESDIWFQIQHKNFQDIQIRFIKTGLWAYTQQMQQNKIYYARDIFNCRPEQSFSESNSMGDTKTNEQYMKLFYQSFQTLAFSLIDKAPFFQANPKTCIYDLYLNNFDIKHKNLRADNQLQISNIMLVILSKQEQRKDIGQNPLSYPVSDIITARRKRIKQDFLLDDEQKQTFEKLKNLAAMDHEKIVQSEGLPFSYIINMMNQISDSIKLYSDNFTEHVERALNNKYNEIDNNCLITEEDLGQKQLKKVNLPQ